MSGRRRNAVLTAVVRAVTAGGGGGGGQRENRVLAERHRVILGGWPIAGAVAAAAVLTRSTASNALAEM